MTEQPEQPRLTIIEELLLDDRLPAEDLLDEDAIRAERPTPAPTEETFTLAEVQAVSTPSPATPGGTPAKRTRTRTRGATT